MVALTAGLTGLEEQVGSMAAAKRDEHSLDASGRRGPMVICSALRWQNTGTTRMGRVMEDR
jgi:hypothetical protein